MTTRKRRLWRIMAATLMSALLLLPTVAFAGPTMTISQVPLTLTTQNRPQVLIALTNSESMDGTLSGAILTGSGVMTTALNSLTNSSSPINYVVPDNFIPPVQAENSAGLAPYTVNKNGILYDNGASRLNIAKAAILAFLQNYVQTTDFALETYSTGTPALYNTWVYYMSPPSLPFSFTNTPVASNRYVINPCYNYLLNPSSTTVLANCNSLAPLYGLTGALLSVAQYMRIGASSDDPNINDVLYSPSALTGVFTTYNGPNPASPYPPNFSLANYNNNSVTVRYNSNSSTLLGLSGFSTSPTNAGYVPFSPQVMYSQRGFGYAASQSATTGAIIVPMTNLGLNPSSASQTNAINLFAPFLNPETNRATTTEIKASAGQAPIAGMMTRALSYMTGLNTSSSGCKPNQYVILISDGLPTLDLAGKSWPPTGSASAIGYGVTATFNADGSLNSTNNQALRDTITAITNLNAAGIKTFVIGLGAGVSPDVNPDAANVLSAMAVAGGTVDYYPATSTVDLVNDLNNILIAVQNGSFSTTSAAVSSTRIQTGTVVVQASFTSSDTPYSDWTGNVVQKSINTSTGLPSSTNIWSAQPQLDSLVTGTGWSSRRLIATWNPTLNSGAGDAIPFLWANLSAAQQALLQPADSLGALRLQYLRGNTSLEIRNGGSFRNRSHILGDIVNSQAIYVGAPSGPFLSNTSYTAFINAQKNRTPMVYVGANDGMLHAFNATTGIEKFAYIPNAVIKNLYNLSATTYNQSHLYFMDGSPESGDVQFSDGSWHTLLVSGESAGGNSIFALDITNAPSIGTEAALANTVLWEFTDADMGLTYSAPQIAPINPSTTTSQTFAVFFGNGYNSTNNKSILYAINPQTGALLRKIDLCAAVSGACNTSLVQGLSTVATGNLDGLQGQPITQVYAGDLQGNLWAIDVSNPLPAQWTVRLLFKARDASNAVQSITTQPVVTLHPIYPRLQGLFVMFGTGQLLTSTDLTNTQTQTIYGVWDKPGNSTTYTRSNLQVQTLQLINTATSGLVQSILINTMNTVTWAIKTGWYDDLPVTGQRVIYNPQLLNGAFLTTLVAPPINICSTTFSSMLLELNYLTGGAFTTAQLDINNSGTITSADNYNGSYPVGVSLLSGLVSSPVILGPDVNGNLVKLFTHASGQLLTVINPNNSPGITSWWQIQ